jgi:uncharacterized protein YvpB
VLTITKKRFFKTFLSIDVVVRLCLPYLAPSAAVSAMPTGFSPVGNRKSKRRSNKSLETTMTQHSVDVFGQRYSLYIYQYADNLWIAVGEFLGYQLRTIDRTELKAVRAWQKAAIEKQLFAEVG